MGGEKTAHRAQKATRVGSPPRGRGKDTFIPDASDVFGDHPRVGGEKTSLAGQLHTQGGSPPRGRGKGDTGRKLAKFAGITPAWAGKRTIPTLSPGR